MESIANLPKSSGESIRANIIPETIWINGLEVPSMPLQMNADMVLFLI